MNTERLTYLLSRWRAKEIEPGEQEELKTLVQETNDQQLMEAIEADIITAKPIQLDQSQWQPVLKAILSSDKKVKTPVRSLWRWAAAAIFIIALGISYLLYQQKTEDKLAEQVQINAPDKNKAHLTLADGSIVYLDSLPNGPINDQITKEKDGSLVYDASQNSTGLNTLTNPRGSKIISLKLADGSRVWLNSESSITYPAQFTSNREVSITGEAYFEVEASAANPFHVRKNETDITVLGTSFNFRAYDDEPVAVTLLNGKLKLQNQLIKPGEQLSRQSSGEWLSNPQPNLEEVMAWKNGFFQFDGATVAQMMRQISRWYDVEIRYEGQPPVRNFTGTLQRELSLPQILRILEKNNIKFRLQGRTLTVIS